MLSLEKMGVVVPVGDSHLCASIDRLAKCSCGQDWCKKEWILEIKCPISIKNHEPRSLAAAKRLKYLHCQVEDDESLALTLRESSSYYTQMQMQMALTDVHLSELWIWVATDDNARPAFVPRKRKRMVEEDDDDNEDEEEADGDEEEAGGAEEDEEERRGWSFDPISVAFKQTFWDELKPRLDMFYREFAAKYVLQYVANVHVDSESDVDSNDSDSDA